MKFPTACWLAAAVLIVAPAPAQESAADLLQRGSAKHRSKDYPGAIADFTAAIAQQKTLNSYFHLARAESLRYVQSPQARRRPPAQATSSTASSTPATKARNQAGASQSELTPLQRAFLQKQMKGDFSGAQADYTEVIRPQPGEPSAYLRRATMNLLLDRAGEAIADLDQVLEFNPHANMRAFAFLLRGVARQVQGDWAAAVADFDASYAAAPIQPAKTRFFRRHLLHRLGRPDTGTNLTAVKALVDQEWLRHLGGYLDGKVPEADLIARTDEGDPTAVVRRRSAAYYHVAMTQLRQGDQARAREFFQRAIAVDMKLGLASEERIAEHVLARAELARLTPPR